MPSPIDTLLRVHASPVPTHTTFAFFGSTVIAPMDCTGCLSKTGLKVVPPLTDFHTPPLAAPAYTVSRWPSHAASTAAIRPLIAAEPMLRAPRPEIVSESTFTGAAGCGVCAVAVPAIATAAAYVAQRPTDRFVIGQFPSREGGLTGGVTGGVTPTAGFSKR